MKELDAIKNAVKRLQSEDGKVWFYRLNRERGECTGASRFRLPIPKKIKKRYFDDLADAILGKAEEDEDKFGSRWERVEKYNGAELPERLYWLPANDKRISGAWDCLHDAEKLAEKRWLQVLDDENRESVNGVGIALGEEDDMVEFLSARAPVKKLKYAFGFIADSLTELTKPVITLPLALDAVAIAGRVYFLGPKVREQLWSRAEERRQVREKVDSVLERDVLSNPGQFESFALRGRNGRRMADLDEERVAALLDGRRGKRLGELFGVRVENGRLATEREDEVNRLVKLITRRGMMDPFKEQPMEVAGAVKWE